MRIDLSPPKPTEAAGTAPLEHSINRLKRGYATPTYPPRTLCHVALHNNNWEVNAPKYRRSQRSKQDKDFAK
ncbi:MAG: hypothetical protein K0U74_04395 [Alphaproteobacteria bacterium]|nr:hypothetical protein [Alphaproteobacteria bacterium]